MVHVDVKKLGRIPNGGGWRLHGRDAAVSVANRHKTIRIGYDYDHTAIDDYTQLAYSEVLPDEKDLTCAEFLHRALAWFAAHGVRVIRLLTDNAMVYRRGTIWGAVYVAWQLKRRLIRPGCPGPTARQNAAAGPRSPNGSTPVPGRQTACAPEPLTDSSPATPLNEGYSALAGRPPISQLAA